MWFYCRSDRYRKLTSRSNKVIMLANDYQYWFVSGWVHIFSLVVCWVGLGMDNSDTQSVLELTATEIATRSLSASHSIHWRHDSRRIFTRSVRVQLLLNCYTVAAPQTRPANAAALRCQVYESSFWTSKESWKSSVVAYNLFADNSWRNHLKQRINVVQDS